ncbi:glycerol-3-phosphate dehydrogenase/oxidase [Tenuibacillus multivorans]|uniref:Glycerol-3-phosphate dehydrogenase n=1 Tax=Tenuibacillus multivorans TaxID=237069 RepID=A0A1H0DIP7_9BACI|nr:glycerol-3-phosphate dehydrogenase/oxidase [Tenuibacillus multivorans]GEL76535.1 glycerol-3-phosphate dehydrogenase [Tenuibacillus multivorans]SDN70020.1 glycerol-3-phosphate dehydrogenase [Tenuibacillus multivorans]
MNFSSHKYRQENKKVLNEPFDLIVIGGGITGAGIALDAITRGLSVLVLEMQDFAAGTSSRSTKLVHGGLRYLKNLEVRMVADVGKEREIVYENGPHVTTPEWMMLPFYELGTFGPYSTNIGLRVYDLLAGVKKSERRQMLSPEETLEKEPLLKWEGLKGSGYYVEYKTDDARLTLEVLKKAIEEGAVAFNYMKVEQFLYRDGQVIGVQARDVIDDEVHDVYGHKLVNATGPWVDELRSKDHNKKEKHLFHTKGVHLVFDQSVFPLQQAVYFDTPDGRMIFAIPRDGKTYVGTTDTAYEDDLANPTTNQEDRTYLLSAIHEMFPNLKLLEDDIESTWSGIRPLIHEEGKDPSEISRKDEIFESDSGLISIAGGKLTGYRKMAEQIVDRVVRLIKKETGETYPKSKTKHLAISGGDVGGSKGFNAFKAIAIKEGKDRGLSENLMNRWIKRYGGNLKHVLDYYESAPEDLQFDYAVYAELMYSLEHELVYRPVDFFVRRTGAMFFHIRYVEVNKNSVIDFMQDYFDWSDYEMEFYQDELELALRQAKEPTPQA